MRRRRGRSPILREGSSGRRARSDEASSGAMEKEETGLDGFESSVKARYIEEESQLKFMVSRGLGMGQEARERAVP